VNEHVFGKQTPNIDQNLLRIPQYEAYDVVKGHYEREGNNREIGIILPVGCGKSGLITLLPFSVKSHRLLVVAPGVKISGQLNNDFDMLVIPRKSDVNKDESSIGGCKIFPLRLRMRVHFRRIVPRCYKH
jgi:hypothetical protein